MVALLEEGHAGESSGTVSLQLKVLILSHKDPQLQARVEADAVMM
jgi:hypothetical protein